MDNFDRDKVLKAALSTLHCVDLPFLLAIPDGAKIKTFSRSSSINPASEHSAKSVSCRANDDEIDKLTVTFDDVQEPREPVADLPENIVVLSGKCIEVSIPSGYIWEGTFTFKLKLDNGGIYDVTPYGESFRYFHKNLEEGDNLKIRVHLGKSGFDLTGLADILRHTRRINTEVELKVECPAMYSWRNSPTLIYFPDQKPFRWREIPSAKAIERRKNGVLISAELVMGRHRVNVENFKHAIALARAIFEACLRGDEAFVVRFWRWNNEPTETP